jgi:hypothetical protein
MKNEILDNLDNKKSVYNKFPSKRAITRGLISALPWIGGTLNHLIFDRAEEIKTENILKAIDEIKRIIETVKVDVIDKDWFDSKEALQMFKALVEKIEFEPSEQKIHALAYIYFMSGTKEYKDDPNKFVVLSKVAQINDMQRKLLIIIASLKPEKREFSQGIIKSSGSAIWIDQIIKKISLNPDGRFWKGKLYIDTELDILASLNLIRMKNIILSDALGYEMTKLGSLVVDYFKN